MRIESLLRHDLNSLLKKAQNRGFIDLPAWQGLKPTFITLRLRPG
jgi:hypothetical protein